MSDDTVLYHNVVEKHNIDFESIIDDDFFSLLYYMQYSASAATINIGIVNNRLQLQIATTTLKRIHAI